MSGPSTVPSATFAGRYMIERELGRGASAVVYLARDLDAARTVAIKVLRPELAESVASDRFLKEIRLTQQLHHPHIVPLRDSRWSRDRSVPPSITGSTKYRRPS